MTLAAAAAERFVSSSRFLWRCPRSGGTAGPERVPCKVRRLGKAQAVVPCALQTTESHPRQGLLNESY